MRSSPAAVVEPHYHATADSSKHNTSDTAAAAAGRPSSSATGAAHAAVGSSHKRGPSSDGLSPESNTASPSSSHIQSSTAGGGGGAAAAAAAGEDQRTKKRRTGPGSRGVANLTPEQLAKKRANDREAQRAIRERTKNQIETLEKRIQDLTSQQPYQELQAAIRAKEAVEAENAEIKQRLSSIMSLIQPVLGGQQVEGLFPSPASNYATTQPATQQQQQQPPSESTGHNHNKASPAISRASPASADPSWHSGGALSVASPNQRSPNTVQVDMLCQQQHDLHNNLQMGSGEHLKLDFLLDPSQQVYRMQPGVNGAQDTPKYNHVPMKHDWHGTSLAEARHGSPGPAVAMDDRQPPHAYHHQHAQLPPRLDYAHENMVRPLTEGPRWPGSYSIPIKNCPATCPLDNLLLDFLAERRQRAAEGVPAQEIVGPKYPSVGSLLNTASSAYAHPLSKVFTDILATFPGICTLPERVGVLYIMFLIMRWQVDPTEENYELLPPWARPTPGQLSCPHPAWIDHIPFPIMRDKLAREYNSNYAFDNYFIPFTTTISLNWPYEATDTLLQQQQPHHLSGEDGGSSSSRSSRGPSSAFEFLINPVFERHLRRNENWSLGELFDHTFPQLRGTYNLKHDGTAPTNSSSSSKTAEPPTGAAAPKQHHQSSTAITTGTTGTAAEAARRGGGPAGKAGRGG